MPNHLIYMSLSDIHLGHDINKTKDIIKNLDMFFIKYKKDIIKIGILFILGDVFDKLVSNNNRDTVYIYGWLSRLVMFCKEYNIKLRILEGTPAHDWKQIRTIDTIINNLKVEIDYKYFDTLEVEYIPEYDINVLYIPDEYKHKASDTYKDVLSLMKKLKIDKVDLAIMHGAFTYQIPYIESESFHSEEDYLNIVKHTINIGHVHNHTQFERILVPGSFDSLTHIDENAIKGALIVDIDLTHSKFKYRFLHNTNALQFTTIHIDDIDTVDIVKRLDNFNLKNKKIHVRLYSKDKSKKVSLSLRELEHQYPNLIIKYTNKLDKKQSITSVGKLDNSDGIKRVSIKINKDTIEDIVKGELVNTHIDKNIYDMVLSELHNII